MKSKSYLGLAASLFLTVFFIGITLFMLLAVIKIGDFDAFPAVLTFTILNLLIFAIVIGLGKYVASTIGTPSYAALCFLTILYTIIQFAVLGFNFKTGSLNGYILVHLILLFVYSAAAIPIAIMGIKNKEDKEVENNGK